MVARKSTQHQIKGLLEPAHSFALISWTCFQDFWNKFYFIFAQLCVKKTCAFIVMGIGKKVMWAGGGMSRGH